MPSRTSGNAIFNGRAYLVGHIGCCKGRAALQASQLHWSVSAVDNTGRRLLADHLARIFILSGRVSEAA